MREHPGEVVFPGGRPEPQDADLRATALREAREELGLTEVEVLGRLSSVPLITSDYRLEPYAALVSAGPLSPSPTEVARVVEIDLLEVGSRPTWQAIPFRWAGGQSLSPVLWVGDRWLFGATCHVLWELLGVVLDVLGRPRPHLEPTAPTFAEVVAGSRAPQG
jgi:hypothetical protein